MTSVTMSIMKSGSLATASSQFCLLFRACPAANTKYDGIPAAAPFTTMIAFLVTCAETSRIATRQLRYSDGAGNNTEEIRVAASIPLMNAGKNAAGKKMPVNEKTRGWN